VSKKVLIVGAGIIGCCTAYSLARRGFAVTIVDRASDDHEGCSFGNAGMVVPSHFVPLAAPGMVSTAIRMMLRPRSPFYIRPRFSPELISWGWKFMRSATSEHVAQAAPLLRDLHLASRHLYAQLAGIPGFDFGLTQRGLLMLCKEQRTLDEEAHVAQSARELNIPAEVLDAKGAAALEPDVQMDVAGAVYFPMDCHLQPDRLVRCLRTHLQSQGVRFIWNAPVTGWKKDHTRIASVCTTHGQIEADEYVLCGGSWSPAIAGDLKLALPMQAGKGYSLTLGNPRQKPHICSILAEARVAVTPMGDALRFGGTMEMSGLHERINLGRVRGIIESVPRYYPAFSPSDFEAAKPWQGLRPCSPDGLPYLGRTRSCANLTIATGHAMMGISLGPITGELAAQLLEGQPPSIDIRLLDPDRYARVR
jgi:D-amino-acid dehydrogenase